jgi:lipopolysaccharide biosynthesis glycosyltransferase
MELNGMKRYYCTYFDHRYLDKGKALYQSMLEYCKDFTIFVLCLSPECYEELQKLNLSRMIPIYLGELEKWDTDLLEAKKTRSIMEYYFTCTPSLPLYIFEHFPPVDLITYLDSDLFFFSDPEPLFDEIQGNSIAIISHKFPPHFRYLEDRGKYNVGWVSFRRDASALSCLSWYRERCIEWCYDRIENGKFADQKYLDYFPNRFPNVIELQHKGANLAPWNICNYSIKKSGPYIQVDGQQLIFYHFHGVKHVIGPIYDSGLSGYQVKMTKIIRNGLYKPYINCLHKNRIEMKYEVNQGIRDGAIYNSCVRDMLRYFNNQFRSDGFSISSLTSNPYVICWGNPRDGS